MNNPAGQQQQQQRPMSDFDFGDYIANVTGNDTHQQQHGLDIYVDFPRSHHPQMNMDSTMAAVGSHSRMDHLPQGQPQSLISAEMLNLKGRLEQQMKLQQLQQLILQHQIELISGQPSINAQQKEVLFHGLLTPGPSSELPAIVPKDLVPPMMLQSAEMFTNNPSANESIVSQLSPHPNGVNPSFSAPAALAFPNSPPFPLPSPAQPGYDLSPLTSPWILPGSTAQQPQQNRSQQQPALTHSQQPRTHLKRTVSSSGDEQGGMRKRVSPNVDATTNAQSRHTVSSPSSATSTPVITGSRQVQFFASSGDTPSPVDLSMPPPAPPASNSEQNRRPTASSASSSTTLSRSGSNSVSPDIAPMTPASILNLRKLTTGLVPMTVNMTDTEKKDMNTAGRKSIPKSKVAARPAAAARGRRGSTAKSGFSPNLKPLLPGAGPLTPTSPLAHPINSTQHSSSQFMATTSGAQGPRKTSHKAAEQKRRDSLKTSFDELRLLLPPVPLLPEDGGDETPLPGSMPPRGPPKGDADGPNRGVSKLALLRCGNGYIRDLKEKVERRDIEIEALRDEVRRLKLALGEDEGEGMDLERDVDEGAAVACGLGNLPVVEESGVDGDEDGET